MGVMISAWVFFCALNPFFSKKSYNKYLTLIVIVYSCIAYKIVFTETMDIARQVISMQYWYRNGWEWFLTNKTGMDPLSAFYFYAIGLTGDYHLIPAISVLITYSFSFATLFRCSRYYNLSKDEMNLMLFCFMSIFVFFYAFSNIRIYMCFAVISFFVYMELIENKCHVVAWFFYISAIFFHYACLPFVVFRFLVYGGRKMEKLRFFLIIAGFLLFSQAGNILSALGVNSGLLYTIQYKLNGYAEYTTFGIEYFIDSLIKVAPFFVLVFVSYFSRRLFSEREYQYVYYCFLSAIFYVCMIGNYQFVLRSPSMLVELFVVLLGIFSHKIRNICSNGSRKGNILINNYKIIFLILLCSSVSNILFDLRYLIMRNITF